jgi:hypothetical protein
LLLLYLAVVVVVVVVAAVVGEAWVCCDSDSDSGARPLQFDFAPPHYYSSIHVRIHPTVVQVFVEIGVVPFVQEQQVDFAKETFS